MCKLIASLKLERELALYFQILSFNFFIGFAGFCLGLGKAGMAELRPGQRTNLLVQQR